MGDNLWRWQQSGSAGCAWWPLEAPLPCAAGCLHAQSGVFQVRRPTGPRGLFVLSRTLNGHPSPSPPPQTCLLSTQPTLLSPVARHLRATSHPNIATHRHRCGIGRIARAITPAPRAHRRDTPPRRCRSLVYRPPLQPATSRPAIRPHWHLSTRVFVVEPNKVQTPYRCRDSAAVLTCRSRLGPSATRQNGFSGVSVPALAGLTYAYHGTITTHDA